MPIKRLATAVAYSQSRNCAPSGAATSMLEESEVKASTTLIKTMSLGVLATSALSLERTTGRTPLPSLPVDSAISCSAQSPKPTIEDWSATMPTLSTLTEPFVLAAKTAPSKRPGFEASSALSCALASRASLKSASMSTPARPAGTRPKAVSAE